MARNRPEPLISEDIDLRDLPYMPLHVRRLRDSDLALGGDLEALGAAVLLWSAAWHQQPAGSLPNDDRILARIVGMDIEQWRAIRSRAMHGFVLCNDDRNYHPIVIELVIKARSSLIKRRDQTASARSAKARKRAKTQAKPVDPISVTKIETSSKVNIKGTIRGTVREGIGNTDHGPDSFSLTNPLIENYNHSEYMSLAVDQIKRLYPKRIGAQPWNRAAQALNKRLEADYTIEQIFAGLLRYKQFCEAEEIERTKYVMMAATFLGPSHHFLEPWTTTDQAEAEEDAAMQDEVRDWCRQLDQRLAAE